MKGMIASLIPDRNSIGAMTRITLSGMRMCTLMMSTRRMGGGFRESKVVGR